MLRSKEFKRLIGFDHTLLVIGSIVVSGIAFPFVFYGQSWNDFMYAPIGNALVGWTIASILVLGNLQIFYQCKKSENVAEGMQGIWKRIFYHTAYTLFAAFLINIVTDYFHVTGLNVKNYTQSAIGDMLLAAILIGFYETAYYMTALTKSLKAQEQLKRQNVESQLEILKNQVKPHFLFNSLNTLTSLIPDEPDLAVDYVQKLSKVYRYILEIKDKKLIPLQEELDCIKAYLFMLKIRFGENLKTEIDETGLNFNHHIVPLSLQLLVENAVKHNIISNKKPLKITMRKGDNGFLLVSNNLQPKAQQMPSTGTGLNNIKSRYEILSNQEVKVTVTEKAFTVALPLIEVD